MSSLLACAYLQQRCNNCGGEYRVSLQDLFAEHAVQREYTPRFGCSFCSAENVQLMRAFPESLLAQIDASWTEIARIAEAAGLELYVVA
jgi:hypothetical protein